MLVAAEANQTHKRSIVRHFAPHLLDDALTIQERRYFALGLARVLVVFVVPSCIVFCTRDWFVDTIVFLVVALVCLVELALALYRYFVLWPEGLQMRWIYWTEIVQAEDQYRLKILGYYIRKIDKFVGRFPPSLCANKIKVHYRKRTWPLLLLFVVTYAACLAFLVQTKREKAVMRTWAFYLLSIGSGLVVLRYAKLHLVELPQVLALRDHPEFAADSLFNAAESIPFARAMPSYSAVAPRMAAIGRPLPYEALDPEWEAREFQKFRTATGGARQQAPYGAYLFGRLMQSDLHQSCQPALPPDVTKLNGSTIQGMCILQVVDVANIAANYEHRTEFSTAGPARTLKLGLTDGHQLVFGFEFSSLPQFSVKVPRGTKIVVENVPVRHGLLMLGPDNCQLLETSVDCLGHDKGQVHQPTEANGLSAGAYSAALVTSQFNSSQQKQPAVPPPAPQQLVARPPTITAAPNDIPRTNTVRSTVPSAPMNTNNETASNDTRSNVVPSVFVDAPSSDEDMDSDTTDPMVEHLFYSPKTPRHPVGTDNAKTAQKSRAIPSRKRPRSPSMEQKVGETPFNRPQAQDISTPARSMSTAVHVAQTALGSSLLDQKENKNRVTASAPPLNPTRPFQYFTARSPTLTAPTQTTTTTRFQIRACIKSVVGFQFNTGKYQLRVSVEDCTATREADVAEGFVTRLMGVPCSEFLQTMQTKVQVAHGWAASMQFALMNLEGVMTFEKSTARSAPLMLIDCRDFQASDTRELLQRVRASLPHKPRK
ncbi:hypothetical protein PC129_g2735 [Phytophthora cactorum]|uniref:RecQ-mediated genome instability protein 1 n=2 Tax=Phytophthora cactorum TaxID=29920 RepID=A0A8T1GJI2_9STRA|nr:hypothetical protein Pcac1_g17630 [Phytophthora cactorum]KAG2930811.1 hypothetical protein PC114_g2351 [Phytophthora cactorum]KAG2942418.1 hypothetical protein PC115_g1432 [Phytophthora cactorum]KAG2998129.1 hypothetical protein PC118_g1421 [Phytophthora cactorum]KAG3077993.1 hypothetical protein PC121_g7341 [Phytophthora cactorum]